MSQPIRFARPSSEVESPALQKSRGISRGTLTLIISTVALVAAAAGAGVTYYRFVVVEKLRDFAEMEKLEQEKRKLEEEKAKLKNEADQLETPARANRIIAEVAANRNSHPNLANELYKLQVDLNHQPTPGALSPYELLAFAEFARLYATPNLDRFKSAAERDAANASAAKNRHEAVKAGVDARVATDVVDPLIPLLQESTQGTTRRDGERLGVPGGNLIMPPVPGGGARATQRGGNPDPFKDVQALPNPLKDTSSPPNPLKDSRSKDPFR
jgi:hypothetical protein